MKKLRLKKWVKYLLLTILDLIFILNLPVILKDTGNLNNYRFNIIVLFTFFIINGIAVAIIERKVK